MRAPDNILQSFAYELPQQISWSPETKARVLEWPRMTPTPKKKKNHKDNTLFQCSFSFSFSFLLCAFVLCLWNSPIPPKFPRSIISGESDTHSNSSQWQLLGCHRKYAIWNLLYVAYLHICICICCHKTLIRWDQNKSCTNRTRSTIT